MLAVCGFLSGNRTDLSTVSNTLDRVLESWDFTSMWGWDFALMAMTCVRLGEADLKDAVELLSYGFT